MLAELWSEFAHMAEHDPLMSAIVGLIAIVAFIIGLKIIEKIAPKGFFKFKNLGKLARKFFEFVGTFGIWLIKLPRDFAKLMAQAKLKKAEEEEERIKEAARKLVGEVQTVVREIDSYTYCYECDIHYNKKLPECPNCFAMSLSEGDAKAIFSILKGVREFRYLSFDREQDLFKYISEKMIGDKVNKPIE